MLLGCEKPPRVVGNVTIAVSNQLDNVPDEAWALGLNWVNQQLANEGIHVVLVPAEQARSANASVMVTRENVQARSDGDLVLVVTGDDWKQSVLDQVRAVAGH